MSPNVLFPFFFEVEITLLPRESGSSGQVPVAAVRAEWRVLLTGGKCRMRVRPGFLVPLPPACLSPPGTLPPWGGASGALDGWAVWQGWAPGQPRSMGVHRCVLLKDAVPWEGTDLTHQPWLSAANQDGFLEQVIQTGRGLWPEGLVA